jgi:hypothetical protein
MTQGPDIHANMGMNTDNFAEVLNSLRDSVNKRQTCRSPAAQQPSNPRILLGEVKGTSIAVTVHDVTEYTGEYESGK